MFWYLKPACSFWFLISEPSYMTSQLCTACCEDSLRVVQRDDFPTWSVTFFPSQNPFWPLSFFLFLSFLINHLVFWDVYHDSFIIVCLSCFVSLECTDISSVTTLLSLLTILFFFFFSNQIGKTVKRSPILYHFRWIFNIWPGPISSSGLLTLLLPVSGVYFSWGFLQVPLPATLYGGWT